jgi:hypothetical protein
VKFLQLGKYMGSARMEKEMPGQKHAPNFGDDLELELERAKNVLHRGLRKVVLFGAALLVNVASIVPFLAGQPLHSHFYTIGRPLLLLAMCLVTLFFL